MLCRKQNTRAVILMGPQFVQVRRSLGSAVWASTGTISRTHLTASVREGGRVSNGSLAEAFFFDPRLY
jgi:hypothetical protein